MKNYEKESFVKIFSIFFISLALLSFVISYLFYKKEVKSLDDTLLAQMKEYNFNFKGKKFDATIVKKDKNLQVDHLYIGKKSVYSLFYISKKSKNLLKIIYPLQKYKNDTNRIKYRIILYYIAVLIVLFLLSLLYAYYALRPMKKAITLIEDFLKDVIHDINTPVTTILLNTKFLLKKNRSDELERIEISADKILSLYKNFEVEIRGFVPQKRDINLYEIISQRLKYFQKLYPQIDMKIEGEAFRYSMDKDAFIRIIDNIISNSCKYRQSKKPFISVIVKKYVIIIKDNGIGIKDVSKVFDRFYKESERGMGIGMSIVKKLCDELDIKIDIQSELAKGTTVKLILK